MEQQKMKHFMYCPWTGLGLSDGFRGNTWLKNRIKVFKQFVVPSLQAQTNKNFTLWCSWRLQEKYNPQVKELLQYMQEIKEFETVFTYSGVCFWDDKYSKLEARSRLLTALHGSMGELVDVIGQVDEVLMTIQPSDDCYHKETVQVIQDALLGHLKNDLQAIGFKNGYLMNYTTGEIAEYNPTTNPPFYTIRFPKDIFTDPLAHAQYTALKHDVPGYEAGTPLPSHEWVGDCFKYGVIQDKRGFLVGTHGSNISTTWQIPFKGESVDRSVLEDFGLINSGTCEIEQTYLNKVFVNLPHRWQRKIRYLAGEKKWILRPVFGYLYNLIRF